MMKPDNGNRLMMACTLCLGILLLGATALSFLFLARAAVKSLGRVAAVPSQDTPELPGRYGLEPAKGVFLIASRRLGDPRFQQTIVLLVRHDKQGSVGLVINRPTEILVSEMLPDIAAFKNLPDPVYYGGPVEPDRLMLIIRTDRRLSNAVSIIPKVYVSGSRDILHQLVARPVKGEVFRVYAGYAGWARGQLRAEIMRGDWHVIQADAETIFSKKSEDIWPRLIRMSSAIQVKYLRENSYQPAWYTDTVSGHVICNNFFY